jgi:hypothetical protein
MFNRKLHSRNRAMAPAARKTFGRKNAPRTTPDAARPTAKAKSGVLRVNPLLLLCGGGVAVVAIGMMALATDPPAPPPGGVRITEAPPRPQAAPSGGKFGAVNDGLSAVSR